MLVGGLGVEVLAGVVAVGVAGDEEVVALGHELLVRVQRRVDGRIPGAGDGPCRQAADAVGVIGVEDLLRDGAGRRPAHILGHGGVPEVVVLHILGDIAAGVGLQLVLGPQRVVGFQPVVEAGADLVVLLGHAGLLLNEGSQDHHLVKGGALFGDGGHQVLGLGVELGVEGVHNVIHRGVGEEFVGVGEEIPLALEQPAFVVGDLVPEGILAEVRPVGAVGAVEEGLDTVHQPLVHKQLGDAHGGGAFGDGDPHGLPADLLFGQGGDDVIVGHAGVQLEIAVLQPFGPAAVPGVEPEQPAVLDDAGLLQLGGDVRHRRALGHRDGLHIAAGADAVHLAVQLHQLPAPQGHQQRHHQHDHQPDGEAAAPAGRGFLRLGGKVELFLKGGILGHIVGFAPGRGRDLPGRCGRFGRLAAGRGGLAVGRAAVTVGGRLVAAVVDLAVAAGITIDLHAQRSFFGLGPFSTPRSQTSRRKYTSVTGNGLDKKQIMP